MNPIGVGEGNIVRQIPDRDLTDAELRVVESEALCRGGAVGAAAEVPEPLAPVDPEPSVDPEPVDPPPADDSDE